MSDRLGIYADVLCAFPTHSEATTDSLRRETGYSRPAIAGALRWLRTRNLVIADYDEWPEDPSYGYFWLTVSGAAAKDLLR